MTRLLQFQLAKAFRQKAFFLYLLAYTIIILSEGLAFKQNPQNDFAQAYAGGKFLIYTLQLQSALIGPLFFLLLAAFAINLERTTGTFHLPLINGLSKKQLLHSKFLYLIILMISSISFLTLFAFLVSGLLNGFGFVFNGLTQSLFTIFLTLISLLTTCIGAVLLCLYTKNVAITISIGLLILLVDNLLNQFMAGFVSNFSFLFYNYAFSLYNGRQLLARDIPLGLGLSIFYASLFYYLAMRKIKKMEF
ncbi:ABC transporter permease [Enterococcus malodoratus]|uniref:ABC transporter permease n=1 Tax=Enterococcus malodoratus TaxID=71451 RepID=UPI0020745090|nr:ABC transporter permease [Enterococcus malodoratus]